MINGGVTASGGRNAQPYVSPTRMDDCNFEERRTFRCVLPQDHAVVLNPGDKLGAEKKTHGAQDGRGFTHHWQNRVQPQTEHSSIVHRQNEARQTVTLCFQGYPNDARANLHVQVSSVSMSLLTAATLQNTNDPVCSKHGQYSWNTF